MNDRGATAPKIMIHKGARKKKLALLAEVSAKGWGSTHYPLKLNRIGIFQAQKHTYVQIVHKYKKN